MNAETKQPVPESEPIDPIESRIKDIIKKWYEKSDHEKKFVEETVGSIENISITKADINFIKAVIYNFDPENISPEKIIDLFNQLKMDRKEENPSDDLILNFIGNRIQFATTYSDPSFSSRYDKETLKQIVIDTFES